MSVIVNVNPQMQATLLFFSVFLFVHNDELHNQTKFTLHSVRHAGDCITLVYNNSWQMNNIKADD